MGNRNDAWYVVSTAVEVLSGVDEEDLGPHYLVEFNNVSNSLRRLRDRLRESLRDT